MLSRPGHPLNIWLSILGMVTFLVWTQSSARNESSQKTSARSAALNHELYGRIELGMHLLREKWGRSATPLNPIAKAATLPRPKALTLIGELQGPAAALSTLSSSRGAKRDNEELIRLLTKLYQDYERGDWSAASLSHADKLSLLTDLGWFGDLALTPANGPDESRRRALEAQAKRAALIVGGGTTVLAILTLFGFFGTVRLVRKLVLSPPVRTIADTSSHGAPFAETFFLWLVAFFLISLAAADLPDFTRMLLAGSAGLLAMIVLVWLGQRGLAWHKIRQTIGWTRGKGILIEVRAGLVTYVMLLPLVALGQLMTFALMRSQEQFNVDSNPIVLFLLEADPAVRVAALIAACIAAPIAEETMFRGVLYHELRQRTQRWSWWSSYLISALATSFIFAVIHPQGLIALPALMAIGFGLATAREMRGSLIAPIVAHALNNGVLVTLILVALS